MAKTNNLCENIFEATNHNILDVELRLLKVWILVAG
jgi:hypothetical protein